MMVNGMQPWWMVLWIGWVAIANCTTCAPSDSLALLSLKGNNSESRGLSSWQAGSDCCKNWLGISCNNSGAVTELKLAGFDGVHLRLSSDVCKLGNLEVLTLTSNVSAGYIPLCIWNLSSLQELDLSTSGAIFQGPLSNEIGSGVVLTTKLQYLLLQGVQLSGPIPNWFGSLIQLLVLDLSQNQITDVPAIVGNLKSLTRLLLSDNSISQLPASLVDLSNLTELDLSGNQISVIPVYFKSFTKLQFLSLDRNMIETLPSFLGDMTSLGTLSLINNSIAKVPEFELGSLSNLKTLALDLNKIETFSLPDSSNLSSLQFLQLSSNLLHSLHLGGNLSSLKYLDLSNNILESVDAVVGRYETLSSLVHLDFSFNRIYGKIPAELGELSSLQFLGLSANNLSGTIPQTLEKVGSLGLDRNNLAGAIPAFIRDVARPMGGDSLNLSHNALTGPIPESICRSYGTVDLSHNNLSGYLPLSALDGFTTYLVLSHNMIEGGIPLAWQNRTSNSQGFLPLEVLGVSTNRLNGTIPAFLGDLLALRILDLSYNQLTGIIPGRLGNLTSLQGLKLNDNLLEGNIPDTLGPGIGSSDLVTMSVRNNNLQGEIPLSLGNFGHLIFLDLSFNNLNGSLPSSLQLLRSTLRVFSVASNDLSGGFPQWITSFTELQVLDLSSNKFEGMIPDVYTEMAGFSISSNSTSDTLYDDSLIVSAKGGQLEFSYVLSVTTYFGLADNRFQGPIPDHLADLRGIVFLTLSRNYFNGSIPGTLTVLSQLESADFSSNQLHGHIPVGFTRLTFLSYFNVSHNNLGGVIPQGGQLQTFPASWFEGNGGLCGYPLPQCSSCIQGNSTIGNCSSSSSPLAPLATLAVGSGKSDGLEEWISPVPISVGFVTGFSGVVYYFLLSKKARRFIYKPVKPIYHNDVHRYGVYVPPK